MADDSFQSVQSSMDSYITAECDLSAMRDIDGPITGHDGLAVMLDFKDTDDYQIMSSRRNSADSGTGVSPPSSVAMEPIESSGMPICHFFSVALAAFICGNSIGKLEQMLVASCRKTAIDSQKNSV